MIDVFEETKSRLTMQDVARHYGYQPNRSNFIHCPFHAGDRTASLKLYPGKGGWHCFACNQGGSVIDFAAQLYGLDALGAVKQLNNDFHLGLALERKEPTPQERQEAQRRQELAKTWQAFEVWRTHTIDQLNAAFREAHLLLKNFPGWDKLTDAQALAIREEAYIEHLSDLLLSGNTEDMMPIFRERGQIGQLCSKILNNTPLKSDAA